MNLQINSKNGSNLLKNNLGIPKIKTPDIAIRSFSVFSAMLVPLSTVNVVFMALSCGQQPDHSTIAGFVLSMKDETLSLFRDVLLVCEQEGLLGGTTFALDGCKLSSNASRKWTGTISEIRKKCA